MTRPILVGGLMFLAVLGASCGARVQELTLETPTYPLRSDLGDLAPAEGRNQRLINDALMTLSMDDGAEYTIEADLFWIVLRSSSDAEDRPVSWFEFHRRTGMDDADMIPVLSELAAAVGWEFDEEAATEWVMSNEDGFTLDVKAITEDDYGIVLEAEDELNNSVSVYFVFPTEGQIPGEGTAVRDPPLFDGRPIDG